MAITDVTPEVKSQVETLIQQKLNEFWENSPDFLKVPLDLPDGVASLTEQACDWIANECDQLGTKLAGS